MRVVNELPSVHATSTIDPPGAHVVGAIMAGLYLVLFVGFLVSWLDARARRRRAEAARSRELKAGPAQLPGTIEGSARVIEAPDERVAELAAKPFTLLTDFGPVRVEPAGPVVFVAGQLADRPLRGGESVEVAGLLEREKVATADGYRGDATEGWVLREGPDGSALKLWRYSRPLGAFVRLRAAKTGMLSVGLFAIFSVLSLTGYLARLTLGEDGEATLVHLGEPTRDGVEATIDLDHDDLVSVLLPADEIGDLAVGPIAYRRVPALPWLGAVGAGVAMPGSGFFFAVIFLVCALAGTVAIAATQLEGGPGH